MTDKFKKVKTDKLTPFTSGPGYMMRQGHKALSRRLAAVLLSEGVAFKHYYYLRSLYEEDGISQMTLSERVGTDRATVTRVLETMERDGLVTREPDPTDGRKVKIYLTPHAKSIRLKLQRLIQRLNRDSLAGIPEADQRRFYSVIERIMDNVDRSNGD